jgi:hypothetical protein
MNTLTDIVGKIDDFVWGPVIVGWNRNLPDI